MFWIFKIYALKFPEFENPEKTKAVILNDQSSSEKNSKFEKELGTSTALFSRGVDGVFCLSKKIFLAVQKILNLKFKRCKKLYFNAWFTLIFGWLAETFDKFWFLIHILEIDFWKLRVGKSQKQVGLKVFFRTGQTVATNRKKVTTK